MNHLNLKDTNSHAQHSVSSQKRLTRDAPQDTGSAGTGIQYNISSLRQNSRCGDRGDTDISLTL